MDKGKANPDNNIELKRKIIAIQNSLLSNDDVTITLLINRLNDLVNGNGLVIGFRKGRCYGVTIEFYNIEQSKYDRYTAMISKNEFLSKDKPKKFNDNHSLKNFIAHSFIKTNFDTRPYEILHLNKYSSVKIVSAELNRVYGITDEFREMLLNTIIDKIRELIKIDTTIEDKYNGYIYFYNNFKTLSKANELFKILHIINHDEIILRMLKDETVNCPNVNRVIISKEDTIQKMTEEYDSIMRDLDAYNKDYEHLDEESFRLKNIGKIKVRLPKNK